MRLIADITSTALKNLCFANFFYIANNYFSDAN